MGVVRALFLGDCTLARSKRSRDAAMPFGRGGRIGWMVFVSTWLGLNPVRGAIFVWDGGHPSQDAWTANQNWNPNGAPANDGTADLLFTGGIRLTPNANNGPWSINSISF